MMSKLGTMIIFLMISVYPFANCLSQTGKLLDDYNTLISVERAFAKTSELMGTRYAFLAFLDEDAVVFNPEPTSGIELYKNRQESNSSLLWKPYFARISKSGDFGFTTGPWEYRNDRIDTTPAITGHYITVWKKNESKMWKLAIDIGIQYEDKEASFVEELEFVELPSSTNKGQIDNSTSVEIDRLLSINDEMGLLSGSEGFDAAFEKYAAQNVRLYRNNQVPIIGKMNAAEYLDSGKCSWLNSKGDISSQADLGYTYGIGQNIDNLESESTVKFVYFRIWQKEGNDWEIIIDVLSLMN